MARKKKAEALPLAAPLPVSRRVEPHYRMHRMPDGSERAEPVQSFAEVCRNQALADFLGGCPEAFSGEHMRPMDSILGELLSELKLQEEAFAPAILDEAWLQAVGPGLADVSRLVAVSRKSARVVVSHPSVRYEVTRLRPQIIQALNRSFGEGVVARLSLVNS
ncbi:MAG: DUF721 domain-containing protein [Akkermansia sp.]|nr:DUF721 domain-containing protein [Akkermansia sp.]